jgi:hypothetical protein
MFMKTRKIKLVYFAALLIIFSFDGYTQAYEYPEQSMEALEFIPEGFLGMSTGINNFNGLLGINGEIKIIRNLTLAGGIGIGSWGYKFAGALRYYIHYPRGFYFGLGYSTATGLKGFETELETTRPGGNQLVELNLNRANNLNLTSGIQWRLGKRFRLGLEFGYSVPLQDKAWDLVTSNVELSDNSEQVLEILTPGGLIVGFGFSVGI